MIKNAQWIREQGENLIKPFVQDKARSVKIESYDVPAISYGCSGFGYDLRLSPAEFKVFKPLVGKVIVNPKQFDNDFLYDARLYTNENGSFFILPCNTYALGMSLEYIDIPANIEVLFIGKSTYARAGIIVNMTPGEAGWKGHLTISISNTSNSDVMIFANEGICQALFFDGENTNLLYGSGKYQNSTKVTTSKV